MLQEPLVSVILPTYNRADLLIEALETVLAQSVPPYEVVVVDDGSTDSTNRVLLDFAKRTTSLKVVSLEHTPLVGRVRNAGVLASSGSILAFLDSDDVWKPDRIENQLRAWERYPAATLAFCNLHTFNEAGLTPGGPYLPEGKDFSGRIVGALSMEPIVVPSTMMVSRHAFDRYGPFTDGIIVEDYEFVLEVAANCAVSYVPEVLVLMRDHSAARARSRVEIANLEYLSIVRRFLKRHPEISAAEKACARQGLANVHLKLVRFYLQRGDSASARKHLAAMARLRPWDRRLPRTLKDVLVTRPTAAPGNR